MPTLTEGRHTAEFLLSEANGYQSRESVVLSSAAAALAAGTLLGKITASGKYIAYSNGASDGSQTVAGILYANAPDSAADQKVTIIARNAEGALALLQGGLRPKSINVGNQAPVQGTKYVMVLPWIAATKEDAQAFKAMSDMGYKITPQRSSSDRALDLVELLGKKGLL